MPAYERKFKVRTGCITCKIRKIKCDETKPVCRKCTSTGRKCDGYALSNSNDRPEPSSLVITQPKRTIKVSNALYTSMSILPHVDDANDRQWLLYFSQHAGPTLSDVADKEFWTHFLPQLSVDEPAIRHALLAVGSSYAYFDASPTQEKSRSIESRSYAIKHYNLAITKLRQHVPGTPEHGAVPLICCLLFICLECLYGNRPVMLNHLNSGLNILSSMISHLPTTAVLDSTVGKLQQIFRRLDAQATLYGRPPSLPSVNPHIAYEIEIPYAFSNMLDAKKSLDLINSASLSFIRLPDDDESAAMNRSQSHSARLLHRTLQEKFISWTNAMDNLDNLNQAQDTRYEDLGTKLRIECCASFIYLSNCLEPEETTYDAYGSQFATIVSLAKTLLVSSDDPTHSEQFRVPSLSPQISVRKDYTGFSLEASLIPSLYLTALKCRDPVTRREAMCLLEQCQRVREGLWDARMHWRVARRVLEIEESSMLIDQGATHAFLEDAPSMKMQASNDAEVKGLISEHFRVRSADIFRGIDEGYRSAQIVFHTKPDGLDGYDNYWTEEVRF